MFGSYIFCSLLLICSLQRSFGSQHILEWHTHNNPDKHIQGVTYEKLHEVFQSYPVDRINMLGDSVITEIKKNCDELVDEREKRHVDTVRLRGYEQIFVEKKKVCNSVLFNCRRMKQPTVFCQSDDPGRRYDYAQEKSKENLIYGRHYRDSCSTIETYFMASVVYPCLCECESDRNEEDRYFSLLDVVADEQKVVTGVRFRKVNRAIHIQIQQGILGPNLTIVGEPQWKNITEISSSDLLSKNISNYKTKQFGRWSVRELEFYKNDFVYAVTSKQNKILLDDVKVGPGRVVTGVRLRQIDRDLRLEIQATPYFTRSGDIQPLASQWIHNPTDNSRRTPVKLEVPDIPSEHTKSTSLSGANQYVQFRTSDFKKDLGQNTVPFIDIQDVVDEQPSPLFGVGIVHKGDKDSAGFIALKGAYQREWDISEIYEPGSGFA